MPACMCVYRLSYGSWHDQLCASPASSSPFNRATPAAEDSLNEIAKRTTTTTTTASRDRKGFIYACTSPSLYRG